jgi:hypothetical protein
LIRVDFPRFVAVLYARRTVPPCPPADPFRNELALSRILGGGRRFAVLRIGTSAVEVSTARDQIEAAERLLSE